MRNIDLTNISDINREYLDKIERKSGVKVSDCYQCGKCSAGCPVAFSMDKKPRNILRLLQLSQIDEVLQAKSPWICATCQTCLARCPNNVDIPSLMEAIRQEAKAHGYIGEKDINRFHDLFAANIKLFGKSHEMVLMGLYNLTTGHLLQDVNSAPKLYFSRKIRIRPHMVKDRAVLKRIMAKCQLKSQAQGGKN
ncbi:MAG: 4Fe-4S dicluster domain-containing protein [Clostridiales bacterium]